jgi:NAD(P)-dependent dehydrogenase (short-subunit alcohol dehydrogenase family)
VEASSTCPGAIDTKLQDQVLEAGELGGEIFRRMRSMRDSGKGATPVDLPARLALFLASDASECLTGRLISAPHDPWQSWDAKEIERIAASEWFTLRRLDPFTIGRLVSNE